VIKNLLGKEVIFYEETVFNLVFSQIFDYWAQGAY
jgi:hypothetical protein